MKKYQKMGLGPTSNFDSGLDRTIWSQKMNPDFFPHLLSITCLGGGSALSEFSCLLMSQL